MGAVSFWYGKDSEVIKEQIQVWQERAADPSADAHQREHHRQVLVNLNLDLAAVTQEEGES